MYFSFLVQNLYVFIQMLRVEIMGLMVIGSVFEVQNSKKMKVDEYV